jgi:hypothetical protein
MGYYRHYYTISSSRPPALSPSLGLRLRRTKSEALAKSVAKAGSLQTVSAVNKITVKEKQPSSRFIPLSKLLVQKINALLRGRFCFIDHQNPTLQISWPEGS